MRLFIKELLKVALNTITLTPLKNLKVSKE
jgi:hypothetical protein